MIVNKLTRAGGVVFEPHYHRSAETKARCMKKFLFLLAAASLIGVATYAQTQRTSRTNSRPHDRSEVTKEAPVTDQDKNNPDRQNKINSDRANTKDSTKLKER